MEREGQRSEEDSGASRTQRLVARLRSGEAESFRELYGRIAPSLWAWAQLRLKPGTATPHEIEDFLQEVWLRAFENLERYDPKKSGFRAWIFGIAKNVAYENWRCRTSTPAASLLSPSASASATLEGWPDVVTSIRSRLSKDEALKLFLDQAAKLDSVDRMLLVHCGLEDLSCAQAASRIGLGEEAVTKRWQRLRTRLREDRCSELLEA